MITANGASGTSHDFYFFNSAGEVWNTAAFVAWSDADYATYRVAATELGASGRFSLSTPPTGATSYEMRVRGASLASSYVVWTEDLLLAANAAIAATQATAAALDASKIPRLTDAIAAGAAVRRNKVAATSTTLDETLEATP